jgi:hypothetical protein
MPRIAATTAPLKPACRRPTFQDLIAAITSPLESLGFPVDRDPHDDVDLPSVGDVVNALVDALESAGFDPFAPGPLARKSRRPTLAYVDPTSPELLARIQDRLQSYDADRRS